MAPLSEEQLQRLLETLGQSGLGAAEAYVSIHRKLVLFFETRPCASPPDQSDKTIDTVARRLAEGTVIENPLAFLRGVANNVFLEDRRMSSRTVPMPDRFQPADRTCPGLSIQNEMTMRCLNRCLDSLSSEDREMIMDYYQGDKRTKINARRKLARRLKVPQDNLRKKASRIRKTLKKCVLECLEEEDLRHIS